MLLPAALFELAVTFSACSEVCQEGLRFLVLLASKIVTDVQKVVLL